MRVERAVHQRFAGAHLVAFLDVDVRAARHRIFALFAVFTDDAEFLRAFRDVAELDGPLKDRIIGLRTGWEAAATALERLNSGSRESIRLTTELVERFSASMREPLESGAIAFCKVYPG